MVSEELNRRIDALERKIDQLRATRFVGVPCEPASEPCDLTFISPCYNEAENLQALYDRVTAVCAQNRITDYEIIWIENGSTDHSMEIMARLHQADPRLRVFQLSRNFGYQGAISCGLSNARGEWVSILDADLQDPPELIPEMVRVAKREGYDVVYGVRKSRKEGSLRRAAYRMFYRIWRLTADIQIPLDAGDFGIMHRRVVSVINSIPERQRFVRGLRAWAGFRQCGFAYDRGARRAGETKFRLRGMISLALDGIISYSTVPLRLTAVVGFIIVTLALLLSGVQSIFRLLAYVGAIHTHLILPPGLTQVELLLVGLAGLNIVTVGLVGEYVGRIYNESKDRPICVIRKTLP